jgi:hypothetical protein
VPQSCSKRSARLTGNEKARTRVSDIFREVDEEVRREQLQKLWDRYSLLIIIGAVLIVAAVGAWRGYQWYEAKKAATAGAAYDAALQLAQDGKHAEAASAFKKLVSDGTSGYRLLASLQEGEQLAAKDADAAVAVLDRVAANSNNPRLLRDVAAIRAGFVLLDKAPFADMTRRLEPLAEPNSPMRHIARELLALSAWRNNDMAAARRWAEAVLADQDAPADLRARIDVLMALTGKSAKS